MCDDDYFVEVGGYSGPRQFTDPGREKWVSIPKMNYRTDCNRHSRQGYPIRLAYALTIHKSQGQTTNKVVVDLGKNEKSLGMAYVALSRGNTTLDWQFCPSQSQDWTISKNQQT